MSRNLANWIEGYMVYTAEQESPDAFHLWTAISTIAGALERDVYFDMSYFLLYPNMYIVLVSPPGKCKKSTAMRIGRTILSQNPAANISTDSTSRERLIMDLSLSFKDGKSAMTCYSSEFATMLTTSGMDMVVFLTDIYDSPNEWTHKTKSGGTNKIRAPYFNLIAATTPDWMARAMPLDTVGIGLTSRIVFIYEDTPRVRRPFPKLSPEQKRLHDLLVEDLVQISQMSGEFVLDPDAEEAYSEWYTTRQESFVEDIRLSGYHERKPMHLLKVGMILSAAKGDKTVITLESLQEALAVLDKAEQAMPKVFAHVGRNPLNADIEGVMAQLLHTPGGISKGELLNRFRHNVRPDELDEILEVLINIGAVQLRDGRYHAVG